MGGYSGVYPTDNGATPGDDTPRLRVRRKFCFRQRESKHGKHASECGFFLLGDSMFSVFARSNLNNQVTRKEWDFFPTVFVCKMSRRDLFGSPDLRG